MEEIKSQLVFLLGSFLSGVAVMFAYELVNVLRGLFQLRTIGKLWLDCIFFTASGVMVFRMVFLCNNGTLRSFFVVAFAMGGILYRFTFGTKLSELLIRVIRQLSNWLKRPFVWIGRKIEKKYKKLKKSP